MDDIVNLSVISADSDALMNALNNGQMVVARSKEDFLYILDFDGRFHLFSHQPGSPEGGQKQFPRDEKHIAVIRNLATVADALFSVEYEKGMNLYSVMSSAENGILSLFPTNDRDNDEEIEFIIPNKKEEGNNEH